MNRPKKGAAAPASAPTTPLADAGELRTIGTALIDPSPYQPRKEFDATELQNLADSMAANGLLQPITVRFTGTEHRERYELIAGERRLRAAKLLMWETIPAVVKSIDDAAAATLATIENLQRANLAPLEEAEAFAALMKANGWTQQQLAERLGVPRTSIGDRVRLLSLPTVWLDEIRAGTVLQVSHGAVLHPYTDCPEAVHAAAFELATKSYEWRDARRAKRPVSMDAFRRIVPQAYGPSLCTLNTSGYDRCPFNPAEYSGPVVTVARYANHTPERMAADPTIWKPLAAAAREKNTDSESASRSSDARPVAKAKVGYGDARHEAAITLPRGTEIARATQSSGKVAGVTVLTTPDARWDVEGALRNVDVELLEAALAPEGKVAKGTLVRVAFPYNNGIDRTATRDKAAVKAARDAHAVRWAGRLAALEAAYPAQAAAAIAQHAVSGAGARALLLRIVGDDEWHDDEARVVGGVAASIDLTPPAGSIEPRPDGRRKTPAKQVVRETRAFLEALPLVDVERLAAAVAAQVSGALATPAEALEREQEAERKAYAERRVPWIEGSGGPLASIDDDDEDEDFDEDLLDDEDLDDEDLDEDDDDEADEDEEDLDGLDDFDDVDDEGEDEEDLDDEDDAGLFGDEPQESPALADVAPTKRGRGAGRTRTPNPAPAIAAGGAS
ncbi:ParB/RepB/Spo0J family partition protein [Roseisolibacter agri]|uniref:HTH cro/C1-type domain-containing protein n=1 Tax=Roseisolibacter agri TaxID=2014610 RepID=A0AA37VA34_9BACT|nr:ParB/RepB/Spo0J family partition protein [Roseisolibacter agri]GLC25033.1 hypothetical protein rosag_15460 [Roseisolibacter agri]